MYNIHFAFVNNKLNSHESSRLSDSGSDTEEVLQTVAFQLPLASGNVPEVE